MVLGMSYGELLVVLGVGVAMFGTRDLPKAGRMAGRVAGWAAGYLFKARGQIQSVAGDAQLAQMHRELQESMYQLQQIRDELHMGSAFLRPGSYMHRVRPHPASVLTHGPQLPDDAPSPSPNAHPHLEDWRTGTTGPGPSQSSSNAIDWKHGKRPSFNVRAPIGRDHEPALSMGTDPTAMAAEIDSGLAGVDRSRIPYNRREGGEQERRTVAGETYGGTAMAGGPSAGAQPEVSPLPLSAVSVGWTEKRGDRAPSGADIMVDVLMEEHLARLAQQYVESEVGKGAATSLGGRS